MAEAGDRRRSASVLRHASARHTECGFTRLWVWERTFLTRFASVEDPEARLRRRTAPKALVFSWASIPPCHRIGSSILLKWDATTSSTTIQPSARVNVRSARERDQESGRTCLSLPHQVEQMFKHTRAKRKKLCKIRDCLFSFQCDRSRRTTERGPSMLATWMLVLDHREGCCGLLASGAVMVGGPHVTVTTTCLSMPLRPCAPVDMARKKSACPSSWDVPPRQETPGVRLPGAPGAKKKHLNRDAPSEAPCHGGRDPRTQYEQVANQHIRWTRDAVDERVAQYVPTSQYHHANSRIPPPHSKCRCPQGTAPMNRQ